MSRLSTLARLAPAMLVSLALAACGGSGDAGPTNPGGSQGTAPSISAQPQGATITVGQSATLSVTATGTDPLTYQWRRNGTAITGAASASYNIASATTADSGSYDVVVTNAKGSTTSAAALLSVMTPLTVAVTGASSVGTQASASYTVTVTGSAANKSVTWSVQEGTGGVITNAGVYTAPNDPGTYHIVATSAAEPTRNASVTVTVYAAGKFRLGQHGLPSGTIAPVVITGPSGFTATTTQLDQTITGVPVGSLSASFPDVTVSGVTFRATDPGTTGTFTIVQNQTLLTGVSYAPLTPPGSGSIANAGTAGQNHIDLASVILPNGKVLLYGGFGVGAEEFDPTSGTFSTVPGAPMNGGGYEANLVLLKSGKAFTAGGGFNDPIANTATYDGGPRTWTASAPMLTARYHHSLTVLPNGKVLAIGGRGAGNTLLGSAELYDPIANTWTATGSLKGAREYQSATVLQNGLVLVAGGTQSNGFVTSAELYDPNTGEFTAIAAPMTVAHGRHRAFLLANGNVALVGGHVRAVDVYNPGSNTFSSPGSLQIPRIYDASVLLPNGKLLVTGGMSEGDAIGSTELFDIATGTSIFGPNLLVTRQEHDAQLLANGKVLIMGGRGLNNVARKGAEYYVP